MHADQNYAPHLITLIIIAYQIFVSRVRERENTYYFPFIRFIKCIFLQEINNILVAIPGIF